MTLICHLTAIYSLSPCKPCHVNAEMEHSLRAGNSAMTWWSVSDAGLWLAGNAVTTHWCRSNDGLWLAAWAAVAVILPVRRRWSRRAHVLSGDIWQNTWESPQRGLLEEPQRRLLTQPIKGYHRSFISEPWWRYQPVGGWCRSWITNSSRSY